MQPIHKSEELLKQLKEKISHEYICSEFEVNQLIREIDKYSHGLEKNHLKALAYSLNNNIKEAIPLFELSLQVKRFDYARNYLVVLNQRSSNKNYFTLLLRFSQEYESITFYMLVYKVSIYLADLEKAECYLNKLIKLLSEEEGNKYKNEFNKTKDILCNYCRSTGLSKNDLIKLANIMISILDDNQVRIVGINYTNTSTHDEKTNLFMITAECDDENLLSEMNMQLAYKLADHEAFLDKKFSVFIGGIDDLSTLKRKLKWL